ncbi:MAG TPA: glycosyltransferase [Bacteroidales bacterium]|nr:glycosyltransferase [Bacteroidales bacterium]
MKISFLTSGHSPFDDRIFYHMARSLADKNHSVIIITSTCYNTDSYDGIKLNCFDGINFPKKQKVLEFLSRLKEFDAEVIICSEPLPVYAAHNYKKICKQCVKVFYDITEWYPSKKNLCVYNQPIRWFHLIRLFIFNIWVSGFTDAFIFGEWYKSRPYRLLFPGKSFNYTSYYPDLKYIDSSPPEIIKGLLRLSYSGKISEEKGFVNFVKTIILLSELRPGLKIKVKVIGWYDETSRKLQENISKLTTLGISVEIFKRQSLTDYIQTIKDTDIFLDLRDTDLENNHCLPIKLFYYAALSRPVIFSDLKSIRKEININEFGFLVNPHDTFEIVKNILMYIDNSQIYIKHSLAARAKIELEYNWNSLESQFIDFVTL